MSVNEELIPPPPVLREKLAQHIREGRTLRALLRISECAAEERQCQPDQACNGNRQPKAVQA